MTIPKHYFVFRSIRNTEELDALFELRYQEFKQSSNEKIVTSTTNKLDVDIYDFRSKHYGLFLCEGDSKPKLVGGVRLVFDEQFTNFEQEKVWLNHYKKTMVIKQNSAPFPLNAYVVNRDRVESVYQEYKSQNYTLREVGRLVIAQHVRSYPLMCFMMQAAAAVSFYIYNSDYIWAGCHTEHLSFYKRWGFVDFTTTRYKGQDGYIMYNSKEQLPMHLRKSAAEIAKMLNKYGKAYFSSENKNDFSPIVSKLTTKVI